LAYLDLQPNFTTFSIVFDGFKYMTCCFLLIWNFNNSYLVFFFQICCIQSFV